MTLALGKSSKIVFIWKTLQHRRHGDGMVVHLKSLLNLTEIYLYDTGVSGNIEHLESLQNLTYINLSGSGVTGNIEHLQSLQDLTEIGLENTGVTGDKEAFHEYRESEGLPYCDI